MRAALGAVGCSTATASALASGFPLLEFHTRLAGARLPFASAVMKRLGPLPDPAAISSMVRPLATELALSLSSASASPACSVPSRCLMSSQLVRPFLPGLALRSCAMRTSTQPPRMRSPSTTNLRSPLRSPSSTVMPSGAQ